MSKKGKKSKKSPIKKINPINRKLVNGARKLTTQVTRLLDDAKVKYKTLQHRVVYTAHDVGATAKKKLNEVAKVVLVRADKDFVLIVLPAHKYIDFQGIKKALKAKKVSLASEKDIAKYLKTKVGLLHPFGNAYNLQTLLDKSMAKAKKMIASAGTYTHSVEVALKDFEKLAKPLIGVFARNKK
ncbi:MAG: YbaK/EbsC family protein [Candidatus Doudnabacteria bacterium]|nr:YbaK/EbsC family protein [Candidatus Doudnabacteria bacterium]